MNRLFKLDYEAFSHKKYSTFSALKSLVFNHDLRFILMARLRSDINNRFLERLLFLIIRRYRRKYGLEINLRKVKGGLHLIHPWNITVNDNAELGERVTLFKGCTIGVIEGGEKSGSPHIGDDVTVCANATICGNVNIGCHSVLAAGSFTNFDVPPYSVVIGNPGVIHKKRHDF